MAIQISGTTVIDNSRNVTNTVNVSASSSVTANTYYGDGSNLTGIVAPASGGGSDEIFWINDQTVTTSYSISSNKNAMSAGPITINSGATVTVPSGSSWVVV